MTAYDAPHGATSCALDTSIVARDGRSTNLRSPRDHVIMATHSGIPQFRAQRDPANLRSDIQIDQGGAHVRSARRRAPQPPFKETAANSPAPSRQRSPAPVTSNRGDRRCPRADDRAGNHVVIDHRVARRRQLVVQSTQVPPTNTTANRRVNRIACPVSANAASTADSSDRRCAPLHRWRHCCAGVNAAIGGLGTWPPPLHRRVPKCRTSSGSGQPGPALRSGFRSIRHRILLCGRGTARSSDADRCASLRPLCGRRRR